MVVEISCKPYVGAYLRKHFKTVMDDGRRAVDLSEVRFVSDFFLNLLSRASARYDKRTTLQGYTDSVMIYISPDEFRRYGFELTKTAQLRFNSFMEDYIKDKCRIYVGIHHRNRGMMVSKAIRRFQEEFSFTEDEFPYATIVKDIQRNVDFDDLFKKSRHQQLSLFG